LTELSRPLTPLACLGSCRVQSCKLSPYYDGKADDVRAAEELNCIIVNGNDARKCAKLYDECREALKRRE
jgi:hypothetical protein